MRDYIAWYLVELRNRLRDVEPKQRVEDFLLETRTHLQESIDDMTSRGIDEGDAVKTAIADFGHPSLVAQSFQGKGAMNNALYWVMILLVFLVSLPVVVMMVSSATDNALGSPSVTTTDFGVTTGVVFGGVFLIALLSRRWCSLPLVAAAVATTLTVAVYFSRTTDAYSLEQGSERFVLLNQASARRQVSERERWLREYDLARPKFEAAIAALKAGDSSGILEYIKFDEHYYVVPSQAEEIRSRAYRPSQPEIPGRQFVDASGYVRLIPLGMPSANRHFTSITGDLSEALKAWVEHGDDYLIDADADRAAMKLEMSAFRTPASPAEGEATRRLILVPLAIVGIYSLGIIALNGIVILLIDLFRTSRRKNWRKQLT